MDASLVSTRFRSRTCWIFRTWTILVNEYPRRVSTNDDEESLNLIGLAESPMKFRQFTIWRKSSSCPKKRYDVSHDDSFERGDTNERGIGDTSSPFRQHAYDESKEQSKGNTKWSRSVGPVINMLFNDRQLFDFAEPSKTTRIFVIELEDLQSMWYDR